MNADTKRFRTSFTIKDALLGNHRKEFTSDQPYDLLFGIFYDREASVFLSEKTTLTIEHLASGEKKRIQVDFLAVDEDDLSTLKVLKEGGFEAWLESVEPGVMAEENGMQP